MVARATDHDALVASLAALAAGPLIGKGLGDGFHGYLLR